MDNNIRICSFCGKANPVMAGSTTGINICNKCVKFMYSHMFESGEFKTKTDKNIMRPSQIKKHLDNYVIGQNDAKITLSVAVYNHYKRIQDKIEDDIEIQKSNILMVGPTGSGKTYLVQTLAKILEVPFAMADATSLTEAGYVGEDVESVITRLIQNADNNVEKAEKGIVYIDEIDKLSTDTGSPARTKDVSGGGVQQALLKLMEGSEVDVPIKSAPGPFMSNANQTVKINTSNILFICGGAFEGLQKSIEKPDSRPIGFGKEEIKDASNKLEPHHLVKYGLMPEFIGRLPIITTLDALTKDSLIRILTEPNNAIIKQYQRLLSMDGIELDFDMDALEYIAEKALKRNSGARGLRSVIESCMKKIMFEAPDMIEVERIRITSDTVETGIPVVIQKAQKEAM